ncbi:GNAT family N-acetyltransferase [Actinomadura sp. 9N215]|uniref:GNAT family N-acetyltransferase n=1 Tax=Actinomadura sp. 9N215 TaxID=3375150 RepID=UPI00379013CA
MRSDVTLRPLDEDLLKQLLDAAVAGADPSDVMPPVPGPPGWTPERRTAFLQFHRSRTLAAEPVEATYAILVGQKVVGAARLYPLPEPQRTAEAGVWIGRTERGHGVGGAVLKQLLALAHADGFESVFVSTTPDNTPVLKLLKRLGVKLTQKGDTLTAWVNPAALR